MDQSIGQKRVTWVRWLLRALLYTGVAGLCVLAWFRVGPLLTSLGVWASLSIICIPVALVLLWDALPSWMAHRRSAHLRALGRQGSIVVPGYFRLTPYTSNRSDRKRYQRDDGQHETILDWMMANWHRVSYLSGRSGTGKSSLLDAYVLPRLGEEADAWRVINIVSQADVLGALEQALLEPGQVWEQPPSSLKGVRLLLARACGEAPTPFLVVLDQFEEFLHARDQDQSRIEAFCQFVKYMTEHGPDNLRFLLVFRTDYLPAMLKLDLPPLVPGDNWLEVAPFLAPAARSFLKGSSTDIPDTLLDRLLQEIYEIEETRGLVRPITLNMVGQVLMSSPKAERVRLDYEHGMVSLMVDYFRKTLSRPLIRRFTPRILKPMLHDDGTKRAILVSELSAESGLDTEIVTGSLVFLANHSLVRCLDPLAGRWAIAHDYVAKQLDLILRRTRFDMARRWRRRIFFGGLTIWTLGLFVGLPVIQASLRDRNLVALVRAGGEVSEGPKGLVVRFRTHPRLDQTTAYLGQLPSLYKLDLSETPVTDLMALDRLPQLQALDLSGAVNADLGTIAELTHLHELGLANLPLKDLEPLKPLKDLVALNLSHSKVEHLDTLTGFPKLERLSLQHTAIRTRRIEQASFDFGTMSLQDLMGVEVTPDNVPFLTDLTQNKQLSALDLTGTFVTGLEPLADLPALRFLILADTRASDATPLAGLTHMAVLDLSRTGITDLQPLQGMTALETLRLSQLKIKDLGPLAGLTRLNTLDLARTDIVDLNPLHGLEHLKQLSLAYTLVSDLTPLKDLKQLKDLDLRGTSIQKLEPSAYLQNLERLILAETRLRDLDILKEAPNLEYLDLSRTEIHDISVLVHCRALKVLVLEETPVPVDALKQLRRTLPNIKIVTNLGLEK